MVISVDGMDLFSEFGIENIALEFDRLFPTWNLDINDILKEIMSGNVGSVWSQFSGHFVGLIWGEINGMKTIFITLLVLGILSGILNNFSELFENQQIGLISFYMNYLIMIIILSKIYQSALALVNESMDHLVSFVKIFIPTYFLMISAANGATTAFTYYQLMLLVVFVVESILFSLFVPASSCYIVLVILNGIWEEDRLMGMITLLKKGISGILKIMIAGVMGAGIIQSMIAPIIDKLKTTAVQKTVSAIPGLGELAGGAWQMIFTTAILVKNSVGVLLMILLFFVCALPLIKLFCMMMLLKSGAAMMGLVSNRKMSQCVDQVGDGILLLLQILFTGITFFMILLAVAACTMNR